MKVLEFIQGRYVQHQAVLKYISRHNNLFKGHIKRVGKELILDDTAVSILDSKYPKPLYTIEDYRNLEYRNIQLEKDLLEKDLIIAKLEKDLSMPWWKRLFKSNYANFCL